MFNSINCNIIDTSGQEKYSKLKYNNIINGAIIMFDTQSKISYKNVSFWNKYLLENYGNIPIVICGNKIDVPNRKIKMDTDYISISVKLKDKCNEVLKSLLKKLT